MDLATLSDALWRERERLEFLLFKLHVLNLLFVAGESEWIVRATDEVDRARKNVGEAELRRAVEVQGAAARLGLPDSPSLRELANAAPESWADLLLEHHRELTTLVTRIRMISELNSELAGSAQRAVDAVMAGLSTSDRDDPLTYVPSGRTDSAVRGAMFVDEEI